MRLPIIRITLLTIVLAGCGVSGVGTPPLPATTPSSAQATQARGTPRPPTATPTFDQAALQAQMNQLSNEATIVAATMVALRFGAAAEPAVATEVARRYQDTVATYTALQPTLVAFGTPVLGQIADPARTAASAAYGAAAQAAVEAAASASPVAGQSADEAALMQRATIAAATMIALHSGAPVAPAVATAAVTAYQDTNATIAAYQPTAQAPPPPPPLLTVEGSTATPVPTPDIQRAPIAPAPSHLAGITLPATQEEIAALFRAMPTSIAGQDRDTSQSALRDGTMGIVYGKIPLSGSDQTMPRIFLIGMDQAPEPSTPGWTGAHVIAATASQSPDMIGAWGRDGHLYWIRTTGPVDPTHTNPNQMLLIGTDTSTWVFQMVATSPEELDALAAALAEAL